MSKFFNCIFEYDAQDNLARRKLALCKGEIVFAQHQPIFAIKIKRGVSHMAKNSVPEAKDALNRFKMEAAQEVGVSLTNGYNGNLTSKEAGSIGGQMVKKMIEAYENSMK